MLPQYQNSDKITLADSFGFTILEKKEIIKLEANGNYTDIYLLGNRKLRYCRIIKEFEDILRPYESFKRTHRSYIVNLDHVKTFSNKGIIELTEDQIAYVGDSFKDEFISYFKH